MYYNINSIAVNGINGYPIKVEIDISRGLPYFEIVGLPDVSVKEAKDRVRAAIRNAGYEFPNKRIIVNMAPADIRKEGTAYDLPIAVGILAASEQLSINSRWSGWAFLGELSLDAAVRGAKGILPACASVERGQYDGIFLPRDNLQEASLADRTEIAAVDSLKELIDMLEGTNINQKTAEFQPAVCNSDIFPDFSEVSGQYKAKRALEIAAAGGHHVIMIGPPGSGKSMLAGRLAGILPAMTHEEMLEVTKVYSAAGLLNPDNPLIIARPVRRPHHSSTIVSLLGGGRNIKPGELSLAHNGVLFLDEIAEFKREVLNSLRQPLEERVVRISRARGSMVYPAGIILVAALNPCPCGYYGYEQVKPCSCTAAQIVRYRSKISGPILDRIDLQTEAAPVSYAEISEHKACGDSSAIIKKRVAAARDIQIRRFSGDGVKGKYTNSEMTGKDLNKYCRLTSGGQLLLKDAFGKFGLSVRSYDKILRTARTVADLDDSADIKEQHLAEALQFRDVERC